MADAIEALAEFVAAYPALCRFKPAASPAAIAAAEAALGMEIPEPYRRFLARFDGGFISLCGPTTAPDWDLPSAEWNSNTLFGTERLVREHADQQLIWQLDRGWPGPWPYLAFCQTDGQELLVFSPPGATGQRAVLDAGHEVRPDEWGVLQPGFEPFLAAYVQGQGQVETIGVKGVSDGTRVRIDSRKE